MRKNKKSSNKNKNNKIPLMKSVVNLNNSSVTIDVILTVPIYAYGTSSNVSFNSGSDVRYIAFALITAGTYPFVDLALIYESYKINKASVVVTPFTNFTSTNILPPMHLTCDPDGTATNPTNVNVVNSMNGHDFNPGAITPKAVSFSFRGISTNTGLWIDTAVGPSGSFYIGINTTGLGMITTALLFEASFMLSVSFRGIRGK